MNGYPGIQSAGVRLLRPGQLDDDIAGGLGLQRLAEITHLPTGITSGQIETVSVPAGRSTAECLAPGDETLLHVVEGHVRVRWGPGLVAETPAGSGDTVLVPAGTPFLAENASASAALQLLIVRSG
ncbi:MAG: hypothetical protein JNK40_05380 [Chromatiales bacterium]|nr:hypothetical protein [Chromatiales bacterium]